MSQVTLILSAIESGDADATSALLPIVYEELRRLARSHMRNERPDHTLQATALVHEAYVRLLGDSSLHVSSRARFFAAASEAMRRILVEHARRKKALKNGGDLARVPLDDDNLPLTAPGCKSPEDLIDLSDALDRLAAEDPQKSELIKLTFFAGLSVEEAADSLGLPRATAYRYHTFARAYLRDAMKSNNEE